MIVCRLIEEAGTFCVGIGIHIIVITDLIKDFSYCQLLVSYATSFLSVCGGCYILCAFLQRMGWITEIMSYVSGTRAAAESAGIWDSCVL